MIAKKELENGFVYYEIKNRAAEAKIALQGAHIFHYKKIEEEPLLWLSDISDFKYGESIRGGIPVCWPWFGMNKDLSLPKHGFARLSIWEFAGANEIDDRTTALSFRLTYNAKTLDIWPYKFELSLHVVISDTLDIELKTVNIDDKAFEITQALHTYFAVWDISHVRVKGLGEKPDLDALTWKKELQKGDVTVEGEVDRVYQEVDNDILLEDKKRTLCIRNGGSSSAVVWNPWIDKCKRMGAMREDAYKHFVCIESANAFEDKKSVYPNESYILKAVIKRY